jgi:large subunit ribosomal protein L23
MRSPEDVVIKPVVSEKSMSGMEFDKYTFFVNRDANKIEIKHAVEKLFKVTVLEVRTMTVKGKLKRQGRHVGRTSNRKKAIVTLKAGDKIAVFEGL